MKLGNVIIKVIHQSRVFDVDIKADMRQLAGLWEKQIK